MTQILRDSLTIAARAVAHWRRQPMVVAMAWLFPLLMVLLFGYLLGGQFEVPAGASYFEFLIPGMLGLTMLFGVETTMAAISSDLASGVTDRLRAMPISSVAVITGRALADLLHALVGIVLLTGLGLAVGWSWDAGAQGVLVATTLLLLLRLAVSWVGVYLALLARDPQAVIAAQVLVWPVGLLSCAFVSPTSMPGAVGTLAEWNPLSSTVGAVRELLGNPGWQVDSWVASHSLEMASIWPLTLSAAFLPLTVVAWRRLRA